LDGRPSPHRHHRGHRRRGSHHRHRRRLFFLPEPVLRRLHRLRPGHGNLPGSPRHHRRTPGPGIKVYPDAKSRAAAANAQFQQVASQYGLTNSGRLAEYFVGLTYIDQGQTGPAQQALEKVASGWDSNLAALGKDALADIYQQTGQDAKAIDIYNELSKGKSTTVPADLAQLQLAELYQAQGKTDQARQILALLKDKSKDSTGKPGAAAEIATQKLNPAPAGAGVPR